MCSSLSDILPVNRIDSSLQDKLIAFFNFELQSFPSPMSSPIQEPISWKKNDSAYAESPEIKSEILDKNIKGKKLDLDSFDLDSKGKIYRFKYNLMIFKKIWR